MISQARPPAGYYFRDVQLEMSLKPFWDHSAKTRDAVCRELFQQWQPLCRYAETISILLWIGDGSEMLEYQGRLDDGFEWGRYHGSANAIHADPVKDSGDPGHTAINGHVMGRDPEQRGVHIRPYLYRPDPAEFSFRWLKELVETLRRVGAEVTGKRILVGETFDIGPEFAVSRFKYQWHREICGGGALFGGKFVRCDRSLDGDDRGYAGFPQGIPQGTSVGTFLGRQARLFFADLGFDFLWLSNGFGFALEPWALTGAIFDGAEFRQEAAPETARRILQFWRDLRVEFPAPIRTRGTNLATGIDLASDASPIREIFRDIAKVEAPVNSPWAALDGDVGLELAGWMSHIARLPAPGFRYRYYIHDPWWLNSPWLDRYQRQPFDIYLPLAVSRLLAKGQVETPSDLSLISVDDSHGGLPPQVPVEVTAEILHAREFQPDAPAPLVWLYPFDAYHELVTGPEKNPQLPFFGDWLVRGLIAHSLPINTVADAAGLSELAAGGSLQSSIILAPVLPDAFGLNRQLLALAESGGRVFFYGPLDEAPSLRSVLNLDLAAPLSGDFAISHGSDSAHTLRHLDFLSAGGWRETGCGSHVLASGCQEGETRAACAWQALPSGGQVGWLRGSLATSEFDPERKNKVLGPRLNELPQSVFLPSEKLARLVLEKLGIGIRVEKSAPDEPDPMIAIHRHRNAFVFSGYQPSSGSMLALKFPLGAPIFFGEQAEVSASATRYAGPPTWHHVCRVFVQQEQDARIFCRIVPPIQHGYTSRLLVGGLNHATVSFFPEPGTEERLEVLRDPKFPYFVGNFVKPEVRQTPQGPALTFAGVSGEILFSW